MKHLLLLAVLPVSLLAQTIEGTWQGTLVPPSNPTLEIRMVFKIAKSGDAYQGTLYNLVAGRQQNMGAITLQGNTVKIAIPGMSGNYDGKIAADGNSITGTLTQGTSPVPLPLERATPQTAWTIPEPPAPPARMAADAKLVFDVATIKPAPPDARNKPFRVQGGQYQILNRNLVELLQEAYPLHAVQIAGAKGWMESERWDIIAKPAAPGQPNTDQLRQMIRSLLAERFQLKSHMEEKELPVYVISMGRTGQHKLKPTNAPPNLPGGDFRGAGTFLGRNSSVANLAELLQMVVLDRPVVDRTGIAGKFDFLLEWRPDEFQFNGRAANMQKPANVDSLPDLFAAFQDQLGLKLEAVKAPVQVYVIDSAQRPSEN